MLLYLFYTINLENFLSSEFWHLRLSLSGSRAVQSVKHADNDVVQHRGLAVFFQPAEHASRKLSKTIKRYRHIEGLE